MTATAPSPRTTPARRIAARLATLVVVGLVLWYAARQLRDQWSDVQARASGLRPEWAIVVGSMLLVLATYALLIHAWRSLVAAWGSRLAFWPAARIWAVSNLGRYLPGKLWSIAAMGLLSQRAGVSPTAATGAALAGTLVNLAAGFAVLLVAGSRGLAAITRGHAAIGLWVAGTVAVGLLALPYVLTPLLRFAARLLRRPTTLPDAPTRTLWLVVLSNVAAWVGYGVAFRLLALALDLGSTGNWLDYLAVFTGSYLAGYLALFVPGGLAVREAAMVEALTRLGLASPVDAWLLAFASRLWLTVVEILPGLYFLARDAALRIPTSRSDASP